jgi:hypothetical protein
MFLAQSPALLLDVSAGIIARGLWQADWERLEMVWWSVDSDELITHPRNPAARSISPTTRRPMPDLGLLHHCGSGVNSAMYLFMICYQDTGQNYNIK